MFVLLPGIPSLCSDGTVEYMSVYFTTLFKRGQMSSDIIVRGWDNFMYNTVGKTTCISQAQGVKSISGGNQSIPLSLNLTVQGVKSIPGGNKSTPFSLN